MATAPSAGAWHQLYANGIVIKDIRHKLFTGWMEPPAFGQAQTHTFDSQLDFQLSTDGGATLHALRAPATMTVTISNVRGFQGRSTYETEVTQLDVSGGDLPLGRDDPRKPDQGQQRRHQFARRRRWRRRRRRRGHQQLLRHLHRGQHRRRERPGHAATNGPAHMELQRIAPAYTFTNNLLPPLTGEYISPQQWQRLFPSGIVITNVVNRAFTAAITPPVPGHDHQPYLRLASWSLTCRRTAG